MKGKFLYVGAAILSLAVISSAVIAKRSSDLEIVYYDQKGQEVGGKYYSCFGSVSQWGTVTANAQKFSSPCDL